MFLICTRDDVFLIVFFAQKILLNSKIHQRTFGLISPRPNHPFTLSFRRPLIWTGLAVFLAQAETRGKLMVGWKRGEFCSDLFRSAQVVFQKICAESLWDIFFWKIPWRNIYSNRIACDIWKYAGNEIPWWKKQHKKSIPLWSLSFFFGAGMEDLQFCGLNSRGSISSDGESKAWSVTFLVLGWSSILSLHVPIQVV